jgi:RecG-like helicase
MRLNTKNADVVRDYYLNLEEAMFAYGEYTMKYMIDNQERQLAIKDHYEEQLKQQLTLKDKELEQEKETRLKETREAKEKLQRALKFNQATKQVEPQEYIYIVTTDKYVPENKYKPGGCESFKLLKSRLTTYNRL